MRRLSYIALPALAAGSFLIAPQAQAASSYTVTATASTTSIDIGQAFTVKGHVSPGARGKYVAIQQAVAGRWVTVQRARVGYYGNYHATVPVIQTGENRYQVLKRRVHNTLRGVSPSFTVVGWRWRPVTDLPRVVDTNNTMLASGTFLGTTYQPYLRQGTASGADADLQVTLGQQCDRLDGHVSGDATSASAATDEAWIRGSLPATPTVHDRAIAHDVVSRDTDPAHVVRGPESGPQGIAGLQGLELSSQMAAGNFVGWGDLRVHCRS